MKKLAILGATGSIGTQSLDVVDCFPGEFQVVVLTANKRIDDLIQLIEKYRPKYVAVTQKEDADQLADRYDHIVFGYGEMGLAHAATFMPKDEVVVLNALVGFAGLRPTIEALKLGRTVLLANKESLVVGGELIEELLSQGLGKIIPIDSEHSAILQCLNGEDKASLSKIILTASGGSFRDLSVEELTHVTKADALRHPNWSMGDKITIDSATMMNKGFEVIEACHLFHVTLNQVETVLHRQSLIHSMVEFQDHSIIAQVSGHDMRLPIEYAMFFPERKSSVIPSLDLTKIGSLTFETLNEDKYPCFQLAKKAFQIGGSMPCVLNAANEAAVQLFLEEKISFLTIAQIVADAMDDHQVISHPTLLDLSVLDQQIKNSILENDC